MQVAFGLLLFFTFFIKVHALELKREVVILNVTEHGDITVFVDFELNGSLNSKLGLAFPETDAFELKNFFVYWNDKSLKVTKQLAGNNHRFFIGDLQLPAIFKFSVPKSKGTKHRLKTTYSYQTFLMDGTKSPEGFYLEYILQTGSKWDKQISEVVFLIRGVERICERIYVLPNSYKGQCNQNGEYAVKLTNIEPSKDFRYILTN